MQINMNKIENFKNLLDIDWLKFPYLLILISFFIVSRIPFVNLGFGTDPDAWRIAISAFDLSYFHIYQISRFPGYPVPEFVNSLFIQNGWLATNSITLIFSLVSVIVFAMILKELEIKNKGLLVLTYSFLPITWINSVNTMDYMWAMSFIMITWLFIIKKQYILAGLMMGLAIGSRMTSIFLILPFVYLILRDNEKSIKMIYFIFGTFISAFIIFLPLFIQYGIQFLTYYPTIVTDSKILEDLNQLGLFALFFGLLILLISAKKLILKLKKNDKISIFLVFTIFLISMIYLGAPYQVEYLIPAIPFGLLLLSNISNRKLFTVFCAFLLLNSFISFGISYENGIVIEKGALIEDIDIRVKLTDAVSGIETSNINNSIIISAEYLPVICYMYEKSKKNHQFIEMSGYNQIHWDHEKNVGYVYLLPLDKINYWHRKGYNIYYIGSSAIDITQFYYKYNITDYNASNAFKY